MIACLQAVGRRWGLVSIAALCKLLVAAAVAMPASEALAVAGINQLPDAERALHAPGGLILVEWLRLEGAQVTAAVRSSALLAIPGAVLLIAPLAFLIAGLGDSARFTYEAHGQRAIRSLPALILLAALTFFAQVMLLLLLLLLWELATVALGARQSFWLALLLAAAALCLCLLVGVVQDLARVLVVGQRLGLRQALGGAVRRLSSQPVAILASYLLPASFGIAAVLLCLSVTRQLTHEPGSSAAWMLFPIHQLCVLLLVACRAVWLHRALELTASLRAGTKTSEGGSSSFTSL